eukprot:TRINITY_DN643_c1_g2_i2.p1 TRINITY_DN643_c1_g2~~TRINITY_DN643_c1_g2_i2.p1  ORF type:complete len:548 (-),score=112.01 TRINITY_DN643_c1_g2_i2:58-1569(-)
MDFSINSKVLFEFLQNTCIEKKQELERVQRELDWVRQDLDTIAKRTAVPLRGHALSAASPLGVAQDVPQIGNDTAASVSAVPPTAAPSCSPGDSIPIATDEPSSLELPVAAGSQPAGSGKRKFDQISPPSSVSMDEESAIVKVKRKRMEHRIGDLQKCYFDLRSKSSHGIDDFSTRFIKFTSLSNFKLVSSFNCGGDSHPCIVTNLAFDRDCRLLALGGVSKELKIYEFDHLVAHPNDLHFPCQEMRSRAKISCLSWNKYVTPHIACSDYDGVVTVWDTSTAQALLLLEEHEKRAWSVDFCRADPTRLASGSDDAQVKIWSTKSVKSVATIKTRANVCCVQFSPTSAQHVAFGSADHVIHLYDLRSTKEPLALLRGHNKAVSYVQFMNGSTTDVVSASTDSTLKLWDLNKWECRQTFTGHVNERNFVGLAQNHDLIFCGSENNSVSAYCIGLPWPLVSYSFSGTCCQEYDEPAQFVSAVTAKTDTDLVVAANSAGSVRVLQLY